MDHIVREQLDSLLQKHVPEASIGALDDVVLDYVVEVLTNLGDADESSFDVDQLCEMIAAYVPEFAQVDSGVVCEWVFAVAHDIQKQESPAKPLHNLIEQQKCDGHNCNAVPLDEPDSEGKLKSLQSEKFDTDERTDPHDVNANQLAELSEDLIDSDHLLLLMEMFPDCTKADVIKTLEAHKGDMDLCIQALLETSNSDQKQPLTEIERKSPSACLRRDLLSMKDDDHLKHTILSKYEFVDTKEDKRSHRPCMPAQEPKKLVRYRDNQVVNTKGERFTVVTKRDQEGEGMKKTYVNIKPLRKYRFH